MTEENIVWVGLLLGITWSFILHLAKAMERHGIEIFSRDKTLKEKGKKPLIYVVGFALNNTSLLWQALAMRYSNASVFSSMFGIGLILLMLYSHYILKEDIKKIELVGAFCIMVGTTAIGIIQLMEPNPQQVVNYSRFYTLLIVILIFYAIMLAISAKKGILVSLIFGLIAGSFGGMDLIFKRIGLKAGFTEIFNPETLPILLLSFIVGFSAFFITQWGFSKGADASKLVPMFNSFYILIPIFFELIIIEGMTISLPKILSIAVIVIGIFLMNMFKDPSSLHMEISADEDEEEGKVVQKE